MYDLTYRQEMVSDNFGKQSVCRLRIGYLAHDGTNAEQERRLLDEAGCTLIRLETSPSGRVLHKILGFIDRGDELVVPSLQHLATAPGGLPNLLRRLDACGAQLTVMRERLSTGGEDGDLLRRAIFAVADLRASPKPGRRSGAGPADAASMAATGAAPGEIARQLGVSRMTVWRWLKRADGAAAADGARAEG